jgi:AbrB family looped-hinge helix DNA binding protein
MTAQTKLSAKGQVVIPKDVRDRLGWPQGSELEVIETAGGVLLRKPQSRKALTFEEATARIRKVVNYQGPPLTIEQLSWSAEADRAYQKSKASSK